MEVLSPYCELPPPSQNDCPTSHFFFAPKWLSDFLSEEKFEAQSQIISRQTFIIKKSLDTTTSGGIS